MTEYIIDKGRRLNKTNPCLFRGKPDGDNELYLGLFVDDFIYFSSNKYAEEAFEKKLASLANI